jgi:hypothetical protein
VFRNACTLARKFTFPIITCLKTVEGKIAAGFATYVVINDEGWIITAAHVIKKMQELSVAEQQTRALEAQVTAQQPLNRKERRAQKKRGGVGPRPDAIDTWSAWWANDVYSIEDGSIRINEPTDLAVLRLRGYDPKYVTAYPIFKDPDKDFESGTSLCRYGFPFVSIQPTYDDAQKKFILGSMSAPPIFPNEGILGRIAEIIPVDPTGNPRPPPPYPLKMIEMTSPGIRGQSGGPIFDSKGTIWAIQSSTRHYPLDFETKVEQFYHVGVGIHTATITGLLKEQNIKHQVSTY